MPRTLTAKTSSERRDQPASPRMSPMDAAANNKKKTATVSLTPFLHILFPAAPLLLFLLIPKPSVVASASTRSAEDSPMDPEPWPESFHALLYTNLSSHKLQITNLWYDWGRRRNLNLIQKQLGVLLHDVEWDNGTSFYYTLPSDPTSSGAEYCRVTLFPVGIPRRDFMDGATYLGRRYSGGFLCDVWEKVEFIWYYQDVDTKRPVRIDFYDGISMHLMTYEPGAQLLDESKWQAPSYCFGHGLRDGVQLQMMTDDGDQLVGESFRRLASL